MLQVAITNVLLWFCIWTPYAVVTMIGQFGNPMLVTPLVSQLPAFLGKTVRTTGTQVKYKAENKIGSF
jgi:r-opsin